MRRHLALAALLALAACSSPYVETTPLTPQQPPRPLDAEVQLFSVRAPDCPFQELALFLVQGGTAEKNREAAIARARELGGDALAGLTQVHVSKTDNEGIQGTVIRFTDPGCRH